MTKKQNALKFLTKPDIPTQMRKQIEDMKGYQLHLVIQRQLEAIDVNKNEGQLCLPIKKLLFYFTTKKERKLLRKKKNNKPKEMEVKILDEGQRKRSIVLKRRNLGKRSFYCLTTCWNSLAETNLLKSGDIIQLWSFRKDQFADAQGKFTSNLYFALNTVNPKLSL